MQNQSRGLLIAIEGIDGSGKSTLARNMATALTQKKIKTVLTKEPGDTQLGALLRTIVQKQEVPVSSKAEFLLFAADRAQHIDELIKPQLAQGAIIISDRFADSSVAYQGFGRGLNIEMIKKINEWVMDGIQPDLVFYVRIPADIALARVRTRTELTAFEAQQSFMHKVLDGFETLYKDREDVIILDGTESPEELTKKAVRVVEKLHTI